MKLISHPNIVKLYQAGRIHLSLSALCAILHNLYTDRRLYFKEITSQELSLIQRKLSASLS
jgi:hypothetical protein